MTMRDVSVMSCSWLPCGMIWLPARNSAKYELVTPTSRTPEDSSAWVGSLVKTHPFVELWGGARTPWRKKLLSLWAHAGASKAMPPMAVRAVTLCTQKRFIGKNLASPVKKGAFRAFSVTRGRPTRRGLCPNGRVAGVLRQGQIDGESVS